MTSRAALQGLIEDDAALNGLGFTRAYGSQAADTPDEERFVIIRWQERNVAFGNRGVQRVTIWFHDRDQDYAVIDKAIERTKDILAAATHVAGADGWILTQADWRGDSQDLIDDGFRTQTRNTAFDVASRYNAP